MDNSVVLAAAEFETSENLVQRPIDSPNLSRLDLRSDLFILGTCCLFIPTLIFVCSAGKDRVHVDSTT